MSERVIQCFLLEPTDQAQRSLRRYRGRPAGACPLPHGYHNAEVVIVAAEPFVQPEGRSEFSNGWGNDSHPHDDPRWPATCGCGYAFGADDDEWQLNVSRLWRRSDTGEVLELDAAPAGAMWYAPWYENVYKGPDGRCLVVKTPGGDWIVDSKASNGTPDQPGWTREGAPPRVTARPSIGIGHGPNGGFRYHGFLTDGRLEEC